MISIVSYFPVRVIIETLGMEVVIVTAVDVSVMVLLEVIVLVQNISWNNGRG